MGLFIIALSRLPLLEQHVVPARGPIGQRLVQAGGRDADGAAQSPPFLLLLLLLLLLPHVDDHVRHGPCFDQQRHGLGRQARKVAAGPQRAAVGVDGRSVEEEAESAAVAAAVAVLAAGGVETGRRSALPARGGDRVSQGARGPCGREERQSARERPSGVDDRGHWRFGVVRKRGTGVFSSLSFVGGGVDSVCVCWCW